MSVKKIIDICVETVYKALFYKYARNIRNYILSKSGDMAMAEDIVQDVFLKLWKKCAEIRFETVKSYLYRAAENQLTDHYRHQKIVLIHRQKQNLNKITNESPLHKLEEKEFKNIIENIIEILPENSRIVFLMSRIENMTYREIAERLELSQKAVEKRMGIALEILRKKISLYIK